jgi:hypothetical protein
MEETLSSPTVSTKSQWIVQGSKGMSEEPYALIGHVRVCGGSGGQPPDLPGSGSPRLPAPADACVICKKIT